MESIEPSGPPPPLPKEIPKMSKIIKSNSTNSFYEIERVKTLNDCVKRINELEREIKLLKILVQKL